jgi:predicted transcriptional regulator
MGRFKVKNIEIVAMSDKEYGKHLNDLYKKVKNRKAKKEERIVLTSISDLNKILTPERLRLIRTIKKKNPKSISILAKLLERDRANVFRDLKYLEGLGLISLEQHKMETTPIFNFEKIHVEISIS